MVSNANLHPYNEGGLEDAEVCVQLRPLWPKAHYRRGIALRGVGMWVDAAAALTRALDLDPDSSNADDVRAALRDAERRSGGTACRCVAQ